MERMASKLSDDKSCWRVWTGVNSRARKLHGKGLQDRVFVHKHYPACEFQAQSDPERMGKHYDAMATKCTTNGLNLGAMKDSK